MNTEKAGVSSSAARQFVVGAASTCSACLFTNPIEVIKTRLQLNGELELERVFRSPWHAASQMLKVEGPSVFLKGLRPALLYQIAMNGVRLGMYRPLKERILFSSSDSAVFLSGLLSGAISGACGSLFGSPMYLIKVRLQTASSAPATRVGHQHTIPTAVTRALQSVVQSEGLTGLWRGAQGQLMRLVIGSSVQLATYDQCKMLLMRSIKDCTDGVVLHVVSGLMSSVLVALATNPFELVATRLVNQKVLRNGCGELYSGVLDCIVQTVRSEGVFGLYKGLSALYLRLGPHTMLTFVFLEQYSHMLSNLSF